MKIKTKTKVNKNKITITTEVQHEFSKLELEILKSLVDDGFYETKFVYVCDPEAQIESDAMYTLKALDLAQDCADCWKDTIEPKNIYVIEQILEAKNVR